jgi:hypothetical protein
MKIRRTNKTLPKTVWKKGRVRDEDTGPLHRETRLAHGQKLITTRYITNQTLC